MADPSSSLDFTDEAYDDIPCLFCDPTIGTPVAVTAPNNTPGIDFALSPVIVPNTNLPGIDFTLVGPDPPGSGECVADQAHLCLVQGRFEVAVTWRTASGSGSGQAVSIGEDAGYFWFFGANNPELFVKVLDACGEPFNRFWVFAVGLTNVETSLVVTDTESGEVRRYDGPAGVSYEAVTDTSAFATCP